jgi:hypothetical protein
MNSSLQTETAALPAGILNAFEPSAERVRFLDQRMRSRLADSLRYILSEANGLLDVPQNPFQEFLSGLERGPVSPLAFSHYNDIVFAIEEDDLGEASRLFGELISLPPHPGGPIISELGDPSRDSVARRYARFLSEDASVKFEVFPPSREAAYACRRQIKDAFALMDAGDPALASEIRALLREIILAAGAQIKNTYTFDGASAFMLWGGIILNASRREGELTMVQMLAHESAHNLVFGLSADEPLVENPPEELFSSPLRLDPRPMEGIYHATFVTARMHRAVKRLLESGILSPSLEENAQKEIAENARLFAKGIQTVLRHGKLTPLGQSIMAGAKAYMDSAA